MNVNWTPSNAEPAGEHARGASADFSLVLGGPLYQLLRRVHLSDDALSLQRRRVITLTLIAWLPLFLLATLSGRLFDGSVAVPFLLDVEVHVKFLVVLPLLIVAELFVHQRMRTVVSTFGDRHMVAPADFARLDSAIASAYRLRNSVAAELLLIAFVYAVGISIVWRQYMALDATTWYAIPAAGGSALTFAGMWYGYVSLPLFQFLLCRWYFRVCIWARLLWQVSRFPLALVPTHPDRVGGLGFLSNTVYAFVPLALAHGALLAGTLASQIFYAGARLTDFRLEIILLMIFIVCLIVGPLMVLAPQLSRAKRMGLREYGTLAQGYVRAFDEKWLRGGAVNEPMLGSGDIQSLADLGNSFEIVRGMRIIPVSKEAVFQLGVATLAPIVPLVLTMMPLEDLLKKLLGVMF
ncbi:MAG: hypothetical protein WBM03_17935 [Steroidobacteraceae bacterium]